MVKVDVHTTLIDRNGQNIGEHVHSIDPWDLNRHLQCAMVQDSRAVRVIFDVAVPDIEHAKDDWAEVSGTFN